MKPATQDSSQSQYEALGVDSGKGNVRATFKTIINNDFPGAFVNIIYDPNASWWDKLLARISPGQRRVLTQHQDGDGSKFVQRLLHYFSTNDEQQIGYAVDDAMAMNGADVAASGFVDGPWIMTQVINSALDKDLKEVVMKSVRDRWNELRSLYKKHGFRISFLGGETADLPDQVRSVVFDMTVTAYAKSRHLITGNVRPGDNIWGFASDGQAEWEERPNSGIMANGLTLGRSALMSSGYNTSYPQLSRNNKFYKGQFAVLNSSEVLGSGMKVGEALLSPTRQWPLLIRMLVMELRRRRALHLLHGISINTGGGATKIGHVGKGGILYVKEMPMPSPIFRLIQAESGESWENMYKTFNCGIGIDIVGENKLALTETLEDVAHASGVVLHELGYCSSFFEDDKNRVILRTPYGACHYD